jgi:hypothetical protein
MCDKPSKTIETDVVESSPSQGIQVQSYAFLPTSWRTRAGEKTTRSWAMKRLRQPPRLVKVKKGKLTGSSHYLTEVMDCRPVADLMRS